MLNSLHIKNLVLINSVELEFERNFNVITGETGAGKSILLDCLSLCLGEKNNNVEVKKGEEKGSVTAGFDVSHNKKAKEILKEIDAESSDDLVIRRTVNSSGKTQAYINDEPVSLNILKKLSTAIVEIYGQHEYSSLMDKTSHVEILDEFGEHEDLLADVKDIYVELKSINEELNQIKNKADEAAREEEFIKFVEKELSSLDPKIGEEQELSEKRIMLQQSSKIKEALNSAYGQISENNVLQNIYSSQKIISKTAATINSESFKTKLQDIHNTLEKSAIELEEAVARLDEINSSNEFDVGNLESLEDRLFAIREMARKYRKQPDELPEYLAELQEKLKLIESFDEVLKELQQKQKLAEENFAKIAQKLSQKRKKSSEKLEKEVNSRLPELKMSGAKFKVEIADREKESWNELGIDRIVFTASTNPGQPFSEIGKVASGGELSRLMLSLKVALSQKRSTACVIFDEIDTGIGGATAEAVGKSLAELGEQVQVISITHQPQVASKAKGHFVVEKTLGKAETKISVRKLNSKESNEEIARMLSGESVTKEARAAALKLKVVN
jgi:DNA repair protein RecN (Recombination protein N)